MVDMADSQNVAHYYCGRAELERLFQHLIDQGFKDIKQTHHEARTPGEISTITVSCIKPDTFKFFGWDWHLDDHHYGELIAVHKDKPDWIVKSSTTAKNPSRKPG